MPGALRPGRRGGKKKLNDRPDLRFALILARSLGRTLEELGETCSAQEFGLWQALYADDPWGPARAELVGGVIASTIANVNRGKDTEPFKPLDFMPYAHLARPAAPAAEPTSADFFQEFGG